MHLEHSEPTLRDGDNLKLSRMLGTWVKVGEGAGSSCGMGTALSARPVAETCTVDWAAHADKEKKMGPVGNYLDISDPTARSCEENALAVHGTCFDLSS